MVEKIISDLNFAADKSKAEFLQSYFRTGKPGYAPNDIFLGVTVPKQRLISKKYFHSIALSDLEKLIQSPVHEHRLTALLILTYKFPKLKNTEKQLEIVKFYLNHINCIDNWDLVDASAHKILGEYLFEQKNKYSHASTNVNNEKRSKNTSNAGINDSPLRGTANVLTPEETLNPKLRILEPTTNNEVFSANNFILYELVNSNNLWERRIAVIATFAFLKRGEVEETLRIAEILLTDPEPYIHKAVGWTLREVGKKNYSGLINFLEKNAATMPRIMLRYAIEKLNAQQKQYFMQLGKSKI